MIRNLLLQSFDKFGNQAMSVESKAKQKTQLLVARIRKAVYLGVLLGLAWFFWRYDFQTIPADYNHLAPQHMPAGATVVLVDYSEDAPLGVGSVLLFEPPGYPGTHSFGVVAGLPGETVLLVEERPGEGHLDVNGRKEILVLPADHKLFSGVIPDDHFLILNGDRHLNSGQGAPDSRVFGLVPRKNLISKLIASLNPFSR